MSVIVAVAASGSSRSAFGDFLLEAFDEFDYPREFDFLNLVGSMALVALCVFVGIIKNKENTRAFRRGMNLTP
ncbi:hypothetical protein B4589_009000 [Halolamina sp. CBA1230]|uniref:hypothetical protein n=1 Tax=Halolamina sp. CBA1230 TaxID=1853690 RepID=UPI001301C3AC|nr:hypothetical protein [Halolamina sp. CBA1230]QKY20508.1 hypothetical protein B4589_009000 [Halolamina sp. CBA1230]